MKKLLIASGVLALMAAATSCDKYDIYPEQYGDVMMIKDAGEKEVTIYATDDAAEYYVSVMKGGHNPGDQSTATLRVMTVADFQEYKDKMYGDTAFQGLDFLDPEFYTVVSAKGDTLKNGSLTYDFNNEDSRYFGVNVVFNAQKISDWRDSLEKTDDGLALLNSKHFVVPIGLYSNTDSVNADNQAITIEPVVTIPVMTLSVEHNNYYVEEVSRTKLLTDTAFLHENLKPEVYLEIPCKNPYGFKVKYTTDNSLVSDFNSSQSKVSLEALKNSPVKHYIDGTPAPTEKNPDNTVREIEFPAGVTKVRFPIEFITENIDADDLTKTWVRGFQFAKAKGGKNPVDMVWADSVPDKVKYSLSLPKVADNPTANYTFFIGYKVVETPLELSEANVTSNDCEPTEGSIGALFDKDLSTFFHSGWTVAFERSEPFGSYLEIDLTSFPEDYNACYFQFTSRSNANPRSPKEVHLYYSNEMDDLTREEDKNAWKFMAKVELKKKLGTSESGELGSLANPVHAENYETFKFLRFCVIKNSEDQSLLSPSTANYWNLAELVMYGKYIEPPTQE